MTKTSDHRPAVEWLTDLQKAKVEGLTGSKPKVSIQDLLERANAITDADAHAPESALIPTSPRSVEACFRLGIDPIELQYHPLAWYKRKGEDEDCTRIRYEKCEAFRQERIRSLLDERKRLIDDNWAPEIVRPASTGRVAGRPTRRPPADSTMVEKERIRLEVLKKRQEKELQQMVQYEVQRKELLDKQQAKIDTLEKRAAELQKQKQENELAWITKQRELELQKLQEEKELEKEAQRLAQERYRREKEQQAREAEEERRRKKEAYSKEVERRQKAEEARLATEAILAQQAEDVRQRKLQMEAQDAERARRLEKEAKERGIANAAKQQKASQRIQSALAANNEILKQKRDDFERRERMAEERRKELEEIRKKEEERKRQEELRKEQHRKAMYSQAKEREEARKKAIRDKADEKEQQLAYLYACRKKEHDIRSVEREFELKLRADKVDSIQKQNLYQRQQLLEKIMDEYDKARHLMRERQDLQQQRKAANMTASLHRHNMQSAMEQLKFTKNIDALANPGGTVNINDLLSRAGRRPATALL